VDAEGAIKIIPPTQRTFRLFVYTSVCVFIDYDAVCLQREAQAGVLEWPVAPAKARCWVVLWLERASLPLVACRFHVSKSTLNHSALQVD
jgi:hypothetical protein